MVAAMRRQCGRRWTIAALAALVGLLVLLAPGTLAAQENGGFPADFFECKEMGGALDRRGDQRICRYYLSYTWELDGDKPEGWAECQERNSVLIADNFEESKSTRGCGEVFEAPENWRAKAAERRLEQLLAQFEEADAAGRAEVLGVLADVPTLHSHLIDRLAAADTSTVWQVLFILQRLGGTPHAP